MEPALCDGIVDRNPARVTGWQPKYQRFEDELDDPRSLALPNWSALAELADARAARSADQSPGHVVIFAACTAARIGEVARGRVGDVDTSSWTWTVRRQTTPAPGGVIDKEPRASAPAPSHSSPKCASSWRTRSPAASHDLSTPV